MIVKGLILLYLTGFGHVLNMQEPQRISAKRFYALITKHPNALIIDVRPSDKYALYRIENAMPLPTKAQLIEIANDLPKQDTLFVYCEKELRSGPAVELLDSLGFKNVFELKGGLISWRRNSLPIDDNAL